MVSRWYGITFSAGPFFGAVIVACHGLVSLVESASIFRGSVGSRFSAVVVIWQGNALMMGARTQQPRLVPGCRRVHTRMPYK